MPLVVPVPQSMVSVANFGKPITDEVNRLTGVVDGRNPTAWQNIPLNTGWVPVGALRVPRMRKIGDLVYLEGYASGSTGAGATTNIFTLPVGFRPLATLEIPTSAYNGTTASRVFCSITVNTNGVCITDSVVGVGFTVSFSTI